MDEEDLDGDRGRRGEVCVPAERWKKRAPSALGIDSVSASSLSSSFLFSSSCSFLGGEKCGTFETALSRFLFNVSIFVPATVNKECRADVKFESMGSIK